MSSLVIDTSALLAVPAEGRATHGQRLIGATEGCALRWRPFPVPAEKIGNALEAGAGVSVAVSVVDARRFIKLGQAIR